jgi:hypothetical protein
MPIVIPALMSRRLNTVTWAGVVLLWFASGIGMLIVIASRVWQDVAEWREGRQRTAPRAGEAGCPDAAETRAA